MKLTATCLILSLSLLTACGGPPQPTTVRPGVLSGTVVDSYTGEPVQGATVEIIGTSNGARADSLGRFWISDLPLRQLRARLSSFLHDPTFVTLELGEGRLRLDTVLEIQNCRYDTTEAYKKAWAMADSDLASGRAATWRLGGLPGGDFPMFLDTALGLPVTGNFSCIVGNREIAREMGYNGRIEKYVKDNGLPTNSRKQWIDQIMHPKNFFAEARKLQPMLVGTAMRDTVVAPDSSYRLVLLTDRQPRLLRVVGPNGVHDMMTLFIDVEKVHFVFGPKESHLLIMKSDEDFVGKDGYCVFDYQYGYRIGW